MKTRKHTNNVIEDVVIPVGYRMVIESWENDADAWNTKTIDGLSLAEAKLASRICQKFMDDDDVGNLYDPSEEEMDFMNSEVMKIIEESGVKKFKDIVLHGKSKYSEEKEDIADIVSEVLYILGLTGVSEFYTRRCDSYNVLKVDEPVRFKDVTKAMFE